ncbi:MAG TPA: RNA polymerase sigma-70 factor [Ohtaekwangia sp.]|nr:RNA polymerase sigma-70 factor [Ohtaekwangia sp.]
MTIKSLRFNINQSDEFPGISEPDFLNLLMTRVQNSEDEAAFRKLFRLLYRRLCAYCERIVLNREVAEEIVSDVFCTIWRNRCRISVISTKSYLYTAVRNRAFDYLRSAERRAWCELESAEHLPAENHTLHDAVEHAELELHFDQCVRTLPRQCRRVFELSRDAGKKYREIADELQISIKTVEAQMGRALRQLRKAREVMCQ